MALSQSETAVTQQELDAMLAEYGLLGEVGPEFLNAPDDVIREKVRQAAEMVQRQARPA